MSRELWLPSQTGYAWDAEDRKFLGQGNTFANAVVAADPPASVDPRVWQMKLDNQASMSSCTGHAMTHCGELCSYVDSHGKQRPQFSRMYAYIRGQKMNNIRGDNGATIAGVVKAAMQYGLCPENLWPYPQPPKYSDKIPGGCDTAASKFKILQHSPITSAENAFQYLGSGYGAIIIGIPWTSGLANSSGRIELRDVKGRGGGHAVALCGYVTDNGSKRFLMANSHGDGWGNKGWGEVHPSCVDFWCDTDCDLIGVTDVSGYDEPRPIDWTQGWGDE